MLRRTAAVCLAVVIALLSGGIANGSTGSENAALKAADFLVTQQRDDGGFGAKESTVAETSLAVIGFKTAGVGLPKAKSGKSAIDYLKANAPVLASADRKIGVQNTSRISQLIIALKIAGEDPKNFAGVNWIRYLNGNKESTTGWMGASEIDHSWAMLALVTAGEKVDDISIQWLKSKQDVSGGYAIDPNTTLSADTNSTSLAIQALIAVGVKPSDPSVKKAIDFLKTQQNKDGGFPFVTPSSFGTDSDTTSTAWVLQALIATGQDIESKTWIKAAITPIGFLMSMQNADGAFAYQKAVPDDSMLSTAQAIPALMGKPFPIKLTASVSTTEKLPQEEPIFSTGALIWIALMIMGLFGALGLAYYVFFVMKRD